MRMGAWPVTLLMLAGCPYVFDGKYDEVRDVDGDGFIAERFGGPDCQDDNPEVGVCDADDDGINSVAAGGTDCDDGNAENFPGAIERCDGVDNDCDGAIDNDDPSVQSDATFYVDVDGDGAGDPDQPRACQEYADPDNTSTRLFSTVGTDCDDDDAAIGPDAVERCDGFDNNCDGVVDDVGLWFVDDDGDGYGQSGSQTVGDCNLTPGSGVASVDGDCNDTDDTVHPDAEEIPYDGIDRNCNGNLDDWDPDFDGHIEDAYWAQAQAANEALPPDERWAIQPGDCDALDPTRFDGNDEVCDGVDNDCDGRVDAEDLEGADLGEETVLRNEVLDVFLDVDGDGYGGTSVLICPDDFDPAVHSDTDEDCFDGGTTPPGFEGADPTTVHVGAEELCDEVDNDCDELIDYAYSAFPNSSPHFVDADGDGFGADAVFACGIDIQRRIVAQGDDCNDSDPAVFLGAPELCGDAVRQDCSTLSPYDCDGDGFEGLYGTAGSGEDCDDQQVTVNTEAQEICDGLDNDCDSLVDSADSDVDTADLPFWYQDLDGDGFGDNQDASPVQQCDEPLNAATNDDDCDDDDADLNPSTRWYLDDDGDGFGDAFEFVDRCTDPGPAYVRVGGDCNDQEPALHPDTAWRIDRDGDFVGDPTTTDAFCSPPAGDNWVLASNGSDCDDSDPTITGAGVYYADADSDGFGDPASPINACIEPPASADNDADCDDTDAGIYPGAIELCDALDNDCDGAVDDDDPSVQPVGGGLTGYQDNDLDGVGSNVQKGFCFAVPTGWSEVSGDCDDDDPSAAPGQVEVCGNTVDEDCDGSIDPPSWFEDADGDGFGEGPVVESSCDGPGAGFVTNDDDCNDTLSDAFPGAPELAACDGIDHDCDGAFEPALTWYADDDFDGFGDATVSEFSCSAPAVGNWVLNGDDCDDDLSSVTFGQIWYADSDEDSFGNGASGRFFCPEVDPDGDGAFTDAAGQSWTTAPGDCDDTEFAIGLAQVFYPDADNDGWGAGAPLFRCANDLPATPPHVGVFGDCDDDDADYNPDANDPDGDGEDTNCDGEDGIAAAGQWWPDLDGDGFGDRLAPPGPPAPGRVPNDSDCDDGDPAVGNGILVFTDEDDDDYGTDPTFVYACEPAPGQAVRGGDCDDANDLVHPGVFDDCDGVDSDCDGVTDENAFYMDVYNDLDGDGVGAGAPVSVCDTAGRVTVPGDCDDLDPSSFPGGTEVCDGRDNDCDTDIDEGLSETWHIDRDGDGFGDITSVEDCAPPGPLWVLDGTDCDDLAHQRFPGAAEICDGIPDNDCDFDLTNDPDRDGDFDGVSFCDDPDDDDPDVPFGGGGGSVLFYPDSDRDGFGDDSVPGTTDPGPGEWSTNNFDCDDDDATVSPAIADVTCDGVDNDCDGIDAFDVEFYEDLDQDGYGAFFIDVANLCAPPLDAGGNPAVTDSSDCDDLNPQAHPDMVVELCDGSDNDCDGAMVNGSFDVVHPLNSTVMAGDPSSIGFISTAGSPTPSLHKTVFMCEPPGFFGTNELSYEGQIYPIEFDPLAATDCEGPTVFGPGTLYLPDRDFDGVAGFHPFDGEDYRELHLNCGGTPPFAYAPLGVEPDCNDLDNTVWQELFTADYADLDGDGAPGLYPAHACVGNLASPAAGVDCDDSFAHGDPRISFQPIEIEGPGDLHDRLQSCIEATLVVDGDDGPWNTPWLPGADLTIRSDHPSSPLTVSLSSLPEGNIRLEGLNLQGTFFLSTTGTQLTLEDVELDGLGSHALDIRGGAFVNAVHSKITSFSSVTIYADSAGAGLFVEDTEIIGPTAIRHTRGDISIRDSVIDGMLELQPEPGEFPIAYLDDVLLRGFVDVRADSELFCDRCEFDTFGVAMDVHGNATLTNISGGTDTLAHVFPYGRLDVNNGSIRIHETVVENEGEANLSNLHVDRNFGPTNPLFRSFQSTAVPDPPTLNLDDISFNHQPGAPAIDLQIGTVYATGLRGETSTLLLSGFGTQAIIGGAEFYSNSAGHAMFDTSGDLSVHDSLFTIPNGQLLLADSGPVELDNVTVSQDGSDRAYPLIEGQVGSDIDVVGLSIIEPGFTNNHEVFRLKDDSSAVVRDTTLFPEANLAFLEGTSSLELHDSYFDSFGPAIDTVGPDARFELANSRVIGNSNAAAPLIDVGSLLSHHTLIYDRGNARTTKTSGFTSLQNTTIWREPGTTVPLIEADQFFIEESILYMDGTNDNDAVATCSSTVSSPFRFSMVADFGQISNSPGCNFNTQGNDYDTGLNMSPPPECRLDDPLTEVAYGEFSD